MLENYSPRWIDEPARKPQYDDSVAINSGVKEILAGRGVERLWSHQAEAIMRIREGENIVLVAPTAAGKTECYMIPVVEAALEGKVSLLVFPTKALSRDQWARIREFALLGVRAEVYDGDTTQTMRSKIRKDMPHVIITNVDMLHFILMHSRLWTDFFKKLKYVVIDEIHSYSGTVGSHVGNVLWRLRRLQKVCANPAPQFIVSSATVGNPSEFASKICGVGNFSLVVGTGSPRGAVRHAIVVPVGESNVTACLKIAKEFDRQTLIFGNSHGVVERLGIVAKRMGLPLQVYRSGLPPEKRRDLEVGFHSGRIKMLASTSALELGMDVGSAEVAILAGFPGTITRLRQRIGRVGRKGQESYAVYVARESPLDLYYAEHPEIYLVGKAESCHAKPDNPFVRASHILAAAKDWPLQDGELSESDEALAKKLIDENMLKEWAGMKIPTKEGIKRTQGLSMRNAGGRVRILDAETKKYLGEREESIAIGELFEGAIYPIGGQRYSSKGIDIEEGIALVHKMPDNDNDGLYTQALRNKHASIIATSGEGKFGDVALQRGKVHISNEVYGYTVKDSFSGQTIYRKELEQPLVHEFDTYAFWADWSPWADGTSSFAEGLHALEHVTIAMMPALSGADPAEIGGISYPNGTVFYYEGQEGGSGLSEAVMPRYGECVRMAFERLGKCECEMGCPKCIFSPQCGNDNRFLSKSRAKMLAEGGLKVSGAGANE